MAGAPSLIVLGSIGTVRGPTGAVRGFLADSVSRADWSQHARRFCRENLARPQGNLARSRENREPAKSEMKRAGPHGDPAQL